jgi:effector-binding domain-containing protein
MASEMISISRFSLMTRLTQKALRIYDEKGILIPQEKNKITGYRYYSISQIETGLKIKSLVMIGLTLEEIACFLTAEENNDTKEIERILSIQLKKIRQEKQHLAGIERFLLKKKTEVIEMINEKPTIKKIPEMRVVCIREKGRFDTTTTKLISILCELLRHPENKKNVTVTGPVMSLCYDEDYKETNADIECAVPISGQVVVTHPNLKIKIYPAGKFLSYNHKGSYYQLYEKYTYLFKYAEEHNIRLTSPNRELYINDPAEVPEDELQTEILIPLQN